MSINLSRAIPRRSFRRLVSACVLAVLAAAAGAQSAVPTVELPVSRVVLYSSGVGFFQHSGSVQDNATVRFNFKTDQINDLLKSMVLRDFSGGGIGAVTYASQDPVARALRSFAVDLSDNPDLASLLARLRGAQVTVMAPQAIAGTILGIERQPRVVLAGGQTVETVETVINLLTPDGIRSLPASAVSSVKLADPRLNDELTRALALIISSADTQRKTVDVQFNGTGSRKVAVEYVAEAPVWKTSYRLDLSGAGFIQGWAIVENTSDADWKNISLSLASGSPVSFRQDLYTPLYVERPEVAPSVQASVTPRAYDEGMGGTASGAVPPPAPAAAPAPSLKKAELARSLAAEREEYAAAEPAPGLAASASLDTAGAAKFGELFNFTVKNAVSLARRQSAMLPLLNQDIAAEKVSIYNQSVLPRNPMAGALLRNTTGLRLPPGPVTVFDAGMYAGDALVDTFGENDQRLLSYAVDLDVLVDPSQNSVNPITKVSLSRGVLNIQRLTTFTQTWKIQNKAAKDKTLVIEHPRLAGRSLVSPKEPWEQTPSLLRFKVPVAKQTTLEFTVKEQTPGTETVSLFNSRYNNFLYYMEFDKVSPAVRAALQKAADLRQKADAVAEEIRAAQTEKSEIESGQGRLRSNIETVGRDTPQGQRYLQKLLEGEDRIDALTAKIQSLQDKQKQAQADFENYLKTVQVD